MNQVHDLAWHTAVFRTLNEARRIEPNRVVNGAFWELTTVGYASVITLGIRKLIDNDSRTDSLWNMIALVEKRPELLTREKFICYDGLPFDHEAVKSRYYESLDLTKDRRVRWLSTNGPEAWTTSEMMQKAFDKLTANLGKRKRTDTVDPSILVSLKEMLNHPAIEKVRSLADKRMAHAERLSGDAGAAPTATYSDIDDALHQIVRVANFLSSGFFYDRAFGSVVPTPQFDVLDGLDAPRVTTENISKLHEHWREISHSMDNWATESFELPIPIEREGQ